MTEKPYLLVGATDGKVIQRMTRQEAIRILKNERRVYFVDGRERKLDKAIDMAIKSLQGDMYCPSCGVRLVSDKGE